MRKSGLEWPEVGHFGDLNVAKIPREMLLLRARLPSRAETQTCLTVSLAGT
jgi:hypothetical protein